MAATVALNDRLVFGSVLAVIVVASIVLNCIAIAVFSRINRMFKNYFLGTRALIINLAVTDLLFILFYSVPTIIVSFLGGTWILSDAMCKIQIVIGHTMCAVNMHMLTVLSTERLMKFFNPKLHEVIFTDTTMAILMIGLWIFDIVIGILPVIGWGAVVFYSYQLQCSFDYVLSVSYQSFSFVIIFLLPLVVIIAFTLAIVIHVDSLIRAQGHGEGLRLGGDEANETYITKLVKLQIYLATLPRKKAKKNAKKRVGRRQKVQDPMANGYGSDSSSDEEVTITTFKKDVKKTFKFRQSDYVTAMTYLACGVTIFLCWFFYIILNYMNTNSLTIQIATPVWLVAVFFTHLCTICKPILYFTQNYKFRLALKYGLRPWLFKEGPIDLRDEMESEKNEKKENETIEPKDVEEGGEPLAYMNYAYNHES